ncbi:CLUMA_CG010535, isoform A [Clunio marinus]|uniref:CLUMA_CG010535, isoform A n=1 Tax=Clunio marinus TaxID=568069 RepID=A0A1J1IBL9_9DIPT|nr:CLUMA_CG010535, isoform A [Clunio marinus]
MLHLDDNKKINLIIKYRDQHYIPDGLLPCERSKMSALLSNKVIDCCIEDKQQQQIETMRAAVNLKFQNINMINLQLQFISESHLKSYALHCKPSIV